MDSEEEGLELAGAHPQIVFVRSFTEPSDTFIVAKHCVLVKSDGLWIMACLVGLYYALSLEYHSKLNNDYKIIYLQHQVLKIYDSKKLPKQVLSFINES